MKQHQDVNAVRFGFELTSYICTVHGAAAYEIDFIKLFGKPNFFCKYIYIHVINIYTI
jgi:hypothetical protein